MNVNKSTTWGSLSVVTGWAGRKELKKKPPCDRMVVCPSICLSVILDLSILKIPSCYRSKRKSWKGEEEELKVWERRSSMEELEEKVRSERLRRKAGNGRIRVGKWGEKLDMGEYRAGKWGGKLDMGE